MLQCVAVCCSVLQCVVVSCSMLQCVAVCCSVLQCVAVFCRVFKLHIYNRLQCVVAVSFGNVPLQSMVAVCCCVLLRCVIVVCCCSMLWIVVAATPVNKSSRIIFSLSSCASTSTFQCVVAVCCSRMLLQCADALGYRHVLLQCVVAVCCNVLLQRHLSTSHRGFRSYQAVYLQACCSVLQCVVAACGCRMLLPYVVAV